MINPIKTASRVSAFGCVLALLCGCATTDSKPAQESKVSEEYVTLEPEIGSRVKKRVKKSELKKYVGTAPTQRSIVTAETDTTMAPGRTTGEVEASNPGAMRPPGT